MGFEIQYECKECGETTPAFKMWRDNAPKHLGQWIYDHAHCVNEYDDEPAVFQRHNENHLLNDGMQDWVFPKSGKRIGWMD
jgi:hypothetical protein